MYRTLLDRLLWIEADIHNHSPSADHIPTESFDKFLYDKLRLSLYVSLLLICL